MSTNFGDNWGVYELSASEFLPLSKQLEENIKDLEAQRLILETQHRKQQLLDSGFGFSSDATVIANLEAESDDFGDDFELPSATSEIERKLTLQQATPSVNDTLATVECNVSHALQGTVHQPPGGTTLAMVHQPLTEAEVSESCTPKAMDVDASTTREKGNANEKGQELPNCNPKEDDGSEQPHAAVEAKHVEDIIHEIQQLTSAEDLKAAAETLASLDAALQLPTSNQNTAKSVSCPETVVMPNEHDTTVGIAKEMKPANSTAVQDISVCEPTESTSLQLEQNLENLEAQLAIEDQHEKQDLLENGLGFSIEATTMANPGAKCDDCGDDSKAPSTPSEAEAKLVLQQSTASLTSESATRKRRLLEGTVHEPTGRSLLAQVILNSSKDQPVTETGENEPDGPKAEDVDTPTCDEDGSKTEAKYLELSNGSEQMCSSIEEERNVEVGPEHLSNTEELRADEQQTTDTEIVASTVTVASPREPDAPTPEVDECQGSAKDFKAGARDTIDVILKLRPTDQETAETSKRNEAVSIAGRIDPANLPLHAAIQMTIEEAMKPTKLPDDANNCSLGCPVTCKSKSCELGYICDKRKGIALRRGARSVLQWWTGGLASRWKLLCMLIRVLMYGFMFLVAFTKFLISVLHGDYVIFEGVSSASTLLGLVVSLWCTVAFCQRHGREILITLHEAGTWLALAAYKCCCCKTFTHLEQLKQRHETERACEHKAAEKYVIIKESEMFSPPQSCCQKCGAFIGICFEIGLTIFDDLILTVVFILTLYSFLGKQEFILLYGSVKASYLFGLLTLLLSALNLIFFVHGLRFLSIAVNVHALDKKVERDSEVMEVKLPNKCVSFQARLVFHVLATSVFQLYGIFALSWKIIQDSCNVVEASSLVATAGTAGAPFTCSSHPLVNGFTIYNILYIAIVPTLLGYTSFFVCNTPWLVEYMQTITMWTYLQIEYMTGAQTWKGDKAAGEGEDGGNGRSRNVQISPRLQLLKVFCGSFLSDEKLKEAGENAKRVREIVRKDYVEQSKKCETNALFRAFVKLVSMVFFVPAAIIGVLQVVLFIFHLSFLGCCFSSDVHAVFLSIQTDAAAVFIPLVILFLMTSTPGPWMGLLWITVVCGIIAAIAAAVASVVAIVAVVVLLIFLAVCLGSNSSRRNQYY